MMEYFREFVRSIIGLAAMLALLFGCAFLTGCSTVKTVYDACEDGLCR